MPSSLLRRLLRRMHREPNTPPGDSRSSESSLPDGVRRQTDETEPLRPVLYWHLSIEPPAWLHRCSDRACRQCEVSHHLWLLIMRAYLDRFRDAIQQQNTSDWEYEQSMTTPWGESTPENAHYSLRRIPREMFRFDGYGNNEAAWRFSMARVARRILRGRNVSSRGYVRLPDIGNEALRYLFLEG